MDNLVVCIGVQKAATSWLHALMSAHPDISASQPKETDFFSYHYDRGAQWYARHFTQDASVYFEASPSYFIDPRSPKRIFAFNPDAKLIVMLRNPVERAFSNHLHEIIKGHIDICDFSTGFKNNPLYVEQGLYHEHLVNWLSIFPNAQIRIVYHEQITENASETIKSLYRFAGVYEQFQPSILNENRNISDIARYPKLRHITRFMGAGLRKLGGENTLSRIKKTKMARAVLAKNSIPVRALIPPLTDKETRDLQNLFADDQAKLALLIETHQLAL